MQETPEDVTEITARTNTAACMWSILWDPGRGLGDDKVDYGLFLRLSEVSLLHNLTAHYL